MDGLEQGRSLGAHGGGRQHAQRTGDDGGLVGEDVTKNVAGEDDVELRRIAHQLHGGVVHVHMAQFHVGVVGVHFLHHGLPEAGGLQHVALFHGADLLATLAGGLEGHLGDAADLVLVVDHGVVAHAQAVTFFDGAGLAEVDVTGQLAHHDEVQTAGRDVGTQQAGAGQLGQQQGGTQVGEQAQGLADAQQALFRTAGRLDIVPLGAAHGAQIHGVGLPPWRRAGARRWRRWPRRR